jgi:hypothetical protein
MDFLILEGGVIRQTFESGTIEVNAVDIGGSIALGGKNNLFSVRRK